MAFPLRARAAFARAAACAAVALLSAAPALAQGSPAVREIDNPIGTTSWFTILGTVIRLMLGLVGSIALVMFLYGGALMMFSAGDSKKRQNGIDAIKAATIGLIIVFSSYAIVNTIFKYADVTSRS